MGEVNDLMGNETRMWFLWSRSLWAMFGDKNSKYFHCRAIQRYQRNKIDGVRDCEGHWQSNPKEIPNEFLRYFSELFSTSSNCQPELALDTIQSLVTEDMNILLNAEFTEKEVKVALNQMAPLKSPGPDGMPPLFSQHYWDLVGKNITTYVLSFLNSTSLPENLNHTFITLIPKVKNLELVSEFCPISLCNVLYKIFSKVLANRLKKILPHIITEHQSAFTKNRLILENILVAFELLHCLQNHKSTKGDFMALKLDMSKANDRVEWAFLEKNNEEIRVQWKMDHPHDALCAYNFLFNLDKWYTKWLYVPNKGHKTWWPHLPIFVPIMLIGAPWFTHPISYERRHSWLLD